MGRRRSSSEQESGPQVLEKLVKQGMDLARKARKQRRSLAGENYYANKLVELRADATNVFRDLSNRPMGDTAAMAEMIEAVFGSKTDHKKRLTLAKELVFSLRTTWRETDGKKESHEKTDLFPLSILSKTDRGYIISVGRQMNGCYLQGWNDACAVMMRRLLEISIIEAFEQNEISDKIKNADADYLQLSDLISRALSEKKWTLSRNTKKYLPHLRDVGHMSAHGRYFHARSDDIERIRTGARVVIEEFLHHAGLLVNKG